MGGDSVSDARYGAIMIALEAGRVIAGRYTLLRPLAEGGMSQLWVTRHVELGVELAIKFAGDCHTDSDQACTRFRREAKTCAILRSPHVVRIHDYGTEEGF